MFHNDLHGLSPADIAILFEPNPYSYDSAVTDPSLPPSPFVQVMREQEEKFYAAFPEARTAAEFRKRRKVEILTFLASKRANSPLRREYSGSSLFDSPTSHVNHNFYDHDPVQSPTHILDSPSLLRIDQDLDPTYIITPRPQPAYPQEAQQQPSSWVQPAPSPSNKRHSSTRTDRPSPSRPSTPTPSGRPRKNPNPSSTNGLAWGSTIKRRPGTTTRTSPPPAKRQQADRKPTLACLFCRGRKIACGAPLPGSVDKTCNQCQRRSLRCEFPAESRRGMRKRKGIKGSDQSSDDQSLPGESILLP